MSALAEINCATVLEAIKKEKQRQKAELENNSKIKNVTSKNIERCDNYL